MSAWPGYRFHRLVQVPREPEQEREKRPGGPSAGPLAAALTGSHADLLGTGVAGAALLTGWVRAPGERQVHVLLAGRPFFPPASRQDGRGPYPVLFPPGAFATEVPAGQAEALLGPFGFWVPCAARPDALWAPSANREPPRIRRGSFDAHVAYLSGPFAWLVLAEPLPPDALDPELAALVAEILPLSRGEVGEAKRVELERKQARHRELSRVRQGGGWRIRVLVGGTDPRAAATAASLLCAAGELDGLPYVLESAGSAGRDPQAARPFTGGTDLLVALTRPPERELPGIRVVEPNRFDVTPEYGGDGLALGEVLDEARTGAGALALSTRSLTRHTFVCGATGGGKSQTVRHLLTEATKAGVPWLVIEPAKAEYAAMSARIAGLGEVIVIRPGAPDAPPAGLNPLEPAPGFPLQTHADLLRALFLAAFEAQEPFPQILAAALTRCYEELGWDLTLGEPREPGHRPRYPTLADLQRVAASVVTDIGYGKDIADNVRGFIAVRIGSLRLGTTGRFFEGGHPLDFARLRERNVVLEIEDVGDDADKAFLMGAVLMRLAEQLRVAAAPGSSGLAHLTVIEEAHRLLRRPEPGTAGPAAHAVELFAGMLAEVRAYGEGLVIAEQIPGKLIPDVIKNTAVKIVHRLPAADDREAVGATMNVDDEQSRALVSLVPGEAAVFGDGMDRPLLVRMPDGSAVEMAGGGQRASVAPVIGRRSPTCGAECAVEACTLRQMRRAQLLPSHESWLTVWVELTVLAHLTGQPVPVPAVPLLEAPSRLVECALSHAVDTAVAVRSPVLQPSADPTELATHVVGALGRMLRGEPSGCAGEDPRFLAVPYRWERVRRALAANGNGGRDARSAEWERAYRRFIPGANASAQLETVTSWLSTDLGDQARRDTATFGSVRPSALEQAIGTGPGWTARVDAALAQFDDCAWPLMHLHVTTELVSHE